MRDHSSSSASTCSTMSFGFKQAFLKNLLLSLQDCSRTTTTPLNAMSLQERKQAVKSSADIAMAAAHGSGASWPKAIILAHPASAAAAARAQRCRRIVRRYYCCGQRRRSSGRRRRPAAAASGGGGGVTAGGVMARRLVRRRTMALRKVIPGGGAMDEASLLREAMDYVVHLRAQVDVLRRVSEAVQRRSTPLRDSWSHCTFTEKED
ncbi:transcription factor IBH1-like 1 [Oryza brachyantha]|uniref:transcription factor IBH1-like 1 n=1 Tax=Oryza brachyantha TaxID=4533 RepID=UPI001ADC3940|nr:transcription factor IBH1-like 1 [Oryza brachyantha]